MKRALSIALILFASISTFAQERTIQKDEFDAVQIKGNARYRGKSYRKIETTQRFKEESAANGSSKIITENASGAIRTVMEFDSPSLSSKNERIMIAGVIYTKSNNADWQVEKNEANPKAENKLTTVSEQIEYKFLGTEKLNNADANVYQKVERRTLRDPSTNYETASTTTTKYWFDAADGGKLKQEANSEMRIKPPAPASPSEPTRKEAVYRNVSTTIWELDPNIKIEAPVISTAFTKP